MAQLLQLTKESIGESHIQDIAWERDGKYIDALRPGAITSPLTHRDEVLEQRTTHLRAVKAVLQELDLFIFTLGLTEAWIRKEDKTVFPSAPGVIAGVFEPSLYEFKNYDFNSIVLDFEEFINRVTALRQGKSFKIILTVSPVPLTATASKRTYFGGKYIFKVNIESSGSIFFPTRLHRLFSIVRNCDQSKIFCKFI